MRQYKNIKTGVVMVLIITLCMGLMSCRTESSQKENDEYYQVEDEKRYVETITDNLKVIEDITYRNVSGEEIKLDIYMPDEEINTPRPAIMLLHSGGMTSGDKKSDSLIKNLSMDFAKMGYVTFNVNYRLSDGESYVDAVEKGSSDITAAFHWIEDNAQVYGVDKNRIAVGGYSAGASLAINVCYSNNPGYDINTQSVLGVIDLSGGDTFYSESVRGETPCLIIHGDADTTVPYRGSEIFQNMLESKGVKAELYTLSGLNHVLTTKYDDIRNKIVMFLYKQLTGKDVVVNTVSEVSLAYLDVELRENNGVEYYVQQIDCVLDGKLNEWENCQEISLSKIKDAGESLPEPSDFWGTAYVGWNESTPGVIYIAAKIRDDILWNVNDSDGKWYNDDCIEIAFDLSMEGTAEQLIKWVIGADAADMSMLATSENTTVFTNKNQDIITYEIAIDLNKIDSNIRQIKSPVVFKKGMRIGLSIAYNDCEEGERQHQIGWTEGKSSDRTKFGNLIFK